MTRPIRYADESQANDILRIITQGYWFSDNGWLNGPRAGAVGHQPIPESNTQAHITPRSVILHSNAGPHSTPWWNLIAYWRRSDITGEAHFQMTSDGTAIQAMPINRRADCNYKANGFVADGEYCGAISFECQDDGAASLEHTPWSASTLDALIQICKALCIQCDIQCDAPAYWNSSGIGHHCLHKEWSIYTGKTCPGAARIAQMDYLRHEIALGVVAFHDHNKS